jgi:alpha-N-arabinofuranosidase
LQDHNTFEAPATIKPATFQGATLNGKTLNVKLPPFSVVVLALK